ncbi:hypothetical protein [Bradyrhizobium sp. BWC-3-1]|uniref:hypothetical protein n=1 Tax=Bradyrhizobium sp. BWC-3-1 TaxID=3080012 RepID=UPI00293F5A38|nr:hypothetical protein [Bradyrhizobium sp. BWC-3-1]WOH55162.1 hypothetical protein RX329_22860 [Bradyrhizobium sp. BWC-3-1]
MNIRSGLLLAAICCAFGNACIAQEGSVGPDGLYQPLPETSPPNQRTRKRANAMGPKPSSVSKPMTWEEENARQQADENQLKRKMNLCQRC